MRKRFEPQYVLGQLPIESTYLLKKSRDSQASLVRALLYIYTNPEWNEKIFSILETKIIGKKKQTGRPGMNLWQLFVLSQFRLCLNINYDRLHTIANTDRQLRQLMGIETAFGYDDIEISYQNIIDNLTLLDDQTIRELNEIIVELGHAVFKKKDLEALRLKTDSFVVKSAVHFPTDYNLLWDSARKSMDTVSYFLEKHQIAGWRKLSHWHNELKSLMRALGKSGSGGGKDKPARIKKATRNYLNKAKTLSHKMHASLDNLPLTDITDALQKDNLKKYLGLLDKHIDLVERRLIKGEIIPHQEKMFSIFEQYTEWITKGKLFPNVELGKNTAITTDQYNLIVDYHIMENETDSEILPLLKERIAQHYKVQSWSFDKGFWNKDNKEKLKANIPMVVMPKKGKRNLQEECEETDKTYIRLRHKHSAIESNIHELEHRGLDHCPDKGYNHFKRYVGLSVCAYNLRRIGKRLQEEIPITKKRVA